MRNSPDSRNFAHSVMAEHLGREPTARECRVFGLNSPNSPVYEPVGAEDEEGPREERSVVMEQGGEREEKLARIEDHGPVLLRPMVMWAFGLTYAERDQTLRTNFGEDYTAVCCADCLAGACVNHEGGWWHPRGSYIVS